MDEWLYEFHVGEVVPGAEDPCYGVPGIGRAFCLDQHNNPEKWAAWQGRASSRPAIHIDPHHGGWTDDPVGKLGAQSNLVKGSLLLGVAAVVTKLLHVW